MNKKRKTFKRYHEPGHLHELTFSCFHGMPLLTNDDWCARLARSIDSSGTEENIQLVAFVFMPNHVHLIVNPIDPEPSLGRYLARVKQPFAKEIKQILIQRSSPLLKRLIVQERPGKTCFRFWQEGPGFDRNIFSPEAITSSIAYIHNNPVRWGLCTRAVDWKWSSARFYLAEPPFIQYPELPFLHRLPVGALDA